MNDFFKKMLPMLGTAVAGPLGGMALEAIGNVLGVKDATETNITKALSTATPEQFVALKKAEQDFQVRMQELGFNNVKDLEAIAAADRDSARKREIAVHDKTPAILAYTVTIGFFGVLGYVLMEGTPEKGGDALLVMLGSLGTAWAGIIAYYFGSSAGSAKKDVTIANLNK